MWAARCAAGVLIALAATAATAAAAQDAPASVRNVPAEGGIEAWDRGTGEHLGTPWSGQRGFMELERLQAEVRMLRMLAGAQEALLAWNRERADSGAGPAVLAEGLCNEPGIGPWCRALPATFGPDAGRAALDEPEEDEER